MNEDQRILQAALRSDFQMFVRRCFRQLNPGAEFLPNWHLEAIGYQLQRVLDGEETRLIVNMPPRHLKSIVISVAFPAFVLGHQPHRRIFAISYGNELAEKHAADFRAIITSRWYRAAFPQMKVARLANDEILTTRRGFRKATSMLGTLTGLGGDLFIIDDPQKPIDALSEPLRTRANNWVGNTLMSRLDNKETGAVIVVMQRVHMDDLSGYLLNGADAWHQLSLPAIAETDEEIQISARGFHRRHAGEALHPKYESLATLEKQRITLGSDVFSAQYQQAPVPPGGVMIKRNWLRYHTPAEVPARSWRSRIILSWDVAGKDGPHNDWSVCTTWHVEGDKFYLLDLTRDRYDFPRLLAKAIDLAKRYRPTKVLVEEASSGIALQQELRKKLSCPVALLTPERSKVARLYVNEVKFEAGHVSFPKGAPFMPLVEAELLSFPNGKTDDIVDSISQALTHGKSGYNLDALVGHD